MRRCSLGLCLVTSLSTIADSTCWAIEGESLNLDGFVERVVREGPTGRVVVASVAQADADVVATGLWPNPSVRIERQSGPVLLDQTNGSQDFLLAEVPIVLSGRLGVEREAAAARASAAVFDARGRLAATRREAVEVFLEVVRAQRASGVLAEERTRLERGVEVARRRAAAGESPPTTPLRLELELARLDDDARLTALAIEEARRHAETLAGGPLPPFLAELPVLPAAPSTPRKRAGSLALERRVVGATLDEDAFGRRVVPDVALTGGPMLLNTGATNFNVGYAVSLGVSLPVFDHGQGDAARAHAARVVLQAERDLVSARDVAAVDLARRQAAAALERASAYERSVVPAAETLLKAAERTLALGGDEGDAAAVLLFVDAARTLREARLMLNALQAGAVLASAHLAFVSGAWDAPEESRP